MSVSDRVRDVVEAPLATSGLELVDVEHTGHLLRVTVDRPGGVDLEAISDVTQLVSAALDRADPIPGGSYALEVSSPGLERLLRTPDQFRRFLGSTVSVKTHPHVAGERRQRATLESADDEGIVLVPLEGPEAGVARRLAYVDIDRARTVFEWGPPPKPGKAPAPKPPKKPAGKVTT